MKAMTLKSFRTVKHRDFANGAVRTEIEQALHERERLIKLCGELAIEMDGVRCPGTAAAIINTMRRVAEENETAIAEAK